MRSQVQVVSFYVVDITGAAGMPLFWYQPLVNTPLISLNLFYPRQQCRFHHHPQVPFVTLTNHEIKRLFFSMQCKYATQYWFCFLP
jgi:hypothetical protein